MKRNTWSRDETLVALNVYCRTPFGRLWAGNPEIIEVAARLRRSPDALAMKCCNLASLDPAQQARGICGLSRASRLDEEVWNEFSTNPEETAFAAELAFAELTQREVRAAEDVQWEDVCGLDRVTAFKVRVNQQFFRSMILASYRSRCGVCELPIASLLVASHIVPWSADKSLRMNPQNGICLCALHDRAFDKGLLRIDPDYRIAIDPEVEANGSVLSIQSYLTRFDGASLVLPDRWHPEPKFLVRHAEISSKCAI